MGNGFWCTLLAMKPETVTDSAVRLVADLDPREGVIEVQYRIADAWRVTLKMILETASDPRVFTSMSVELEGDAASEVDRDISNRLLRLIPFRDAHQCADRLMLDFWTSDAPKPPAAPKSAREYAQLARSFEFFAHEFPEQPLKQMAERFDLNRNTLAARVNRAKDLGLLSRSSKTAPYELTKKAEELLDGGEG